MRSQRRLLLLAATGAATLTFGAAASCGINVVGTRPVPDVYVEPDAPLEASLPEGAPPRDGGNDGDATAPGCPTGRGPSMIAVPGDAGFCIDGTEVTNADYDAFLAATGGKVDGGAPDGGMPAVCGGAAYIGFTRKLAGTGTPDQPIDRVTWCDALAYCAWAGKRLCGKLVDRDAGTGEFHRACSNNGTRVYPYGDTFDPNECNAQDFGAFAGPRDAGEGCEGGLPGLFDMSGNVAEWIDSCLGAGCTSAGGFYGSFSYEAKCTSTSPDYVAATQAFVGVGFRCCADLP